MVSPLPSSLVCLLLMGASWALPSPVVGQQAPPRRKPVATAPRQTLFPDTLHARPLLVSYWTRAQVDSIQQSLGDNRRERAQMLEDSTGRYRVFRGEDYLDRRLFYCPVSSPTRWIEFDLNPWLRDYNELAYLHAYVVHLDQQTPEEIMVKMGGGSYGSGYRTMVDHTLLLSLDGSPRLLWHSIDSRTEEIPAQPDETGEMTGGNYAEYQRTVAMRQGLVYVSPVKKEGKFDDADPKLTPITPGYYQYRGGRFRRVAVPPKVLKSKKPQPAG
ncbi:MAG: hypothetical protein ACRYF0_19680 [Janthinobacterium lividum]